MNRPHLVQRLLTALPVLLSALALNAHAANDALLSGVFSPARAAPDIMLPASDGGEFRLQSLRGKVVVLEFGFTSCAEVCPVSLAAVAAARKKLGAQAAQVQLVFVTVDPERDTPARLRTYLQGFDASFVGVSGTTAQMEAVRKDYGISASKSAIKGSKDYTMQHSSYLYFIDRKGMLRALMPFGRPVDDIVHDLRVLLKQ